MPFFARFSPIHAIRDLRLFLSHRQPYELGFLALALVVTVAIIAGFVRDSHVPTPYKRNIVYVEQWRADRSAAQIAAQQKIDQVVKHKQQAELDALQKQRQAEFKRLDDKLKAMGI